MRLWADRVDPDGAPRLLTAAAAFTFEAREGVRFRDDGRGCTLWYTRRDYERAFTEADTSWEDVDTL
jgi:hypothetical protein